MEGCGEGLVVACSGDPPMLELELLVERLPSEGNLHESTGSFLLKDQKLSAIKDSKYHFLMLFLGLEER